MEDVMKTPGRVVGRRKQGLLRMVWHKGILTGYGTVIEASAEAGKVVETPLHAFADGQVLHDFGYPGTLPPEIVVRGAYALIGQPYSLFKDNCEHLVHEVHGLGKKSPQLAGYALIGVVLLAGVFLLARQQRA